MAQEHPQPHHINKGHARFEGPRTIRVGDALLEAGRDLRDPHVRSRASRRSRATDRLQLQPRNALSVRDQALERVGLIPSNNAT
jgi:hypothetical protein